MCVAAAGWRTGDSDHVIAAPGAGLAEDRLGAVVMVGWIESVALLLEVDLAPARKCAGDLSHVALGVIPDPQREEFEELAGEVLVGMSLGTTQPVEPAEHGSVAQDLPVQLADGGSPVLAERQVLREHQLG